MQATIEENIVALKTRELCETLVEQPEFRSIRQRIETFLGDEPARTQYQLVMEKGEALQQKQQLGMPMSNEEIGEFEKHREVLLANAIARDFMEAQEQMHKMQESVMQYVGKTFELGRVPTTEDLSSGGCGSGCGCGH